MQLSSEKSQQAVHSYDMTDIFGPVFISDVVSHKFNLVPPKVEVPKDVTGPVKLSRDSKPENTKDNEQETKSKEGQVEATNETVVVDINEPVKKINAVKDSVTIDLKAKLATLEEEAPRGE